MVRSNIPLHTSLLYAIISGLWIYCSDNLLATFIADISVMNLYQTYKGLFFVSTTSVLLFFLLRRQMSLLEKEKNDRTQTEKYFQEKIDINDISNRKQVEIALQESEERLRLSLKAANQGLYDLNIQTGDAIVSPEYATMLEYDPDTFHETNSAWIGRLHPDDKDHVSANYRDYIAGKLPEYRVEFRQRTRSGGWVWIMSIGKIVAWDNEHRPLRMLGMHTDITAKKQSEEEIKDQMRELRRWHDATLGREKRILELKQEVNSLLAQSGKPVRYASTSAEGDFRD